MRIYSIISAAIISGAVVSGCQQHVESQDRLGFSISGTITAEAGDTAYLKLIKEDGYEFVDSSRVDTSGNFLLRGPISHSDFYILHFSNQDQQIMLMPDTCQSIRVESQSPDYVNSYAISGSPESEALQQLVSRLHATRMISDSLSRIFRANINSPNLAGIKRHLDSVYQRTYADQLSFSRNFLESNPQSLTQIVCLSQYITPKSPVFDPDADFDTYKQVLGRLQASQPDNFHVRKLASYVDKISRAHQSGSGIVHSIIAGDTARNVSMAPIGGGSPVSLESLRGRWVILDFAATWSDVSLRNTENLMKIYWKWRESGLSVYQVYIDQNPDRCKQYVRDHKIPWHAVSDYRMWESQAARDFGVRQLPSTFIISPDFIVTDVNLSAPQLDDKLQDLFGKKKK